ASRGRLVITAEHSSVMPAKPQLPVSVTPERLGIPPVVSLSAEEGPVVEAESDEEAAALVTQPQADFTPHVELSIVAEEIHSFPEEAVKKNGAGGSLL